MLRRLWMAVAAAALLAPAPAWALNTDFFVTDSGLSGDPLVLPMSGTVQLQLFGNSSDPGIFGISGLVLSATGGLQIVSPTCAAAGAYAGASVLCAADAAGNFGMILQNVDPSGNAWVGTGRIATFTLNITGPGTLQVGGPGRGAVVEAPNFDEVNVDPPDLLAVAEPTPEPGAIVLLGLSLGSLAFARRRA